MSYSFILPKWQMPEHETRRSPSLDYCVRALRTGVSYIRRFGGRDSRLRNVAFVVGLCMGLTLLGPAAFAREYSKEVQALIIQAKAEKELNVQWSDNAFDGPRGAAAFMKGFNDYYGTNIKFNYSPGVAMTALGMQVAEQQQAGQPSDADVLIAGEGQVPVFYQQKILQSVNWKPLIPNLPTQYYDQAVSPDGTMVAVYSTYRTIVYNTMFVSPSEAPHSLHDLLNPKWKGHVATTSYAAGFGSLTEGGWTQDQVLQYAKKLTSNLGGVMRCGEYDRLTSGEFWIFGLDCEPSRVEELIKEGAPLAQGPAMDDLQITHWCLGIPKNAQHSAVAKLFIAWMLSPEGQKLVYQYQGGDLHYLPGSQTAIIITQIEKSTGQKFVDLTPAKLIADFQHESQLQSQVANIFRSASLN